MLYIPKLFLSPGWGARQQCPTWALLVQLKGSPHFFTQMKVQLRPASGLNSSDGGPEMPWGPHLSAAGSGAGAGSTSWGFGVSGATSQTGSRTLALHLGCSEHLSGSLELPLRETHNPHMNKKQQKENITGV